METAAGGISTHFRIQEILLICNTNKYYNSDVRMGAIASQITSLTIVYSTVYSDADQRKYQSPASLAFVWGIHRGKCFHFMTSSCCAVGLVYISTMDWILDRMGI